MNLSELEEALGRLPRVLTPKQVAELIGVTERVLRLWRAKGYGPAFRRVGRKFIKYDEPAVLAWLEQQHALTSHRCCPTCGARVFHAAQGEPAGGRHETA